MKIEVKDANVEIRNEKHKAIAPSPERSTMRSILIVTTCTAAMILNVSTPSYYCCATFNSLRIPLRPQILLLFQ